MNDRVKLFRGEYRGVWERRLVAKGWPQPLAGLTAAFLTGDGPMPAWKLPDTRGEADKDYDMERYAQR